MHGDVIVIKKKMKSTCETQITSCLVVNVLQLLKDKYATYEEVQQALRKAGLEGSDLIIGIDATTSNTWNGKLSFSPYSENLHTLIGDSYYRSYFGTF